MGDFMRCPYRKFTTENIISFGTSTIDKIEQFPECHGESCPLYNDKLTVPCSRATKERNEAYIKLEAKNG